MSEKISKEQMNRMQAARSEGVTVRNYLQAISGEATTLSEEERNARVSTLERKLSGASPLDKLKIRQQIHNVKNGIADTTTIDLVELEKKFIAALPNYSERNGIVAEVWEEMGVKPEIITKAGL